MPVHILTPYSLDKDLGKAYNEAMALLPEDDWACLIDYDVQFLTSDCGKILHEYASRNPDAGLLTCFTNRIGSLSVPQMMGGAISENSDVKHHIQLAEKQKEHLYKTTRIDRDISGFLMLIKKSTWKEMPFPETGQCLGVDTKYGRMVREAGKKILRMDGLYVFHSYRLINGVKDKSHLRPPLKNFPLINILIRTSNRPDLFSRCIKSIQKQTYQNYKIIVGCDNPDCDYLPDDVEKIYHKPQPEYPAFWNLYCNGVKEAVNEGWFFFLDDDDMLSDATALERIAYHLTNPDEAVICRMKRWDFVLPKKDAFNNRIVERGNIGIPCIFLHHSRKAIADLDGYKAADYRFIKQITQKIPAKWVNEIVAEIDRESKGQ